MVLEIYMCGYFNHGRQIYLNYTGLYEKKLLV